MEHRAQIIQIKPKFHSLINTIVVEKRLNNSILCLFFMNTVDCKLLLFSIRFKKKKVSRYTTHYLRRKEKN